MQQPPESRWNCPGRSDSALVSSTEPAWRWPKPCPYLFQHVHLGGHLVDIGVYFHQVTLIPPRNQGKGEGGLCAGQLRERWLGGYDTQTPSRNALSPSCWRELPAPRSCPCWCSPPPTDQCGAQRGTSQKGCSSWGWGVSTRLFSGSELHVCISHCALLLPCPSTGADSKGHPARMCPGTQPAA